MNSPTLSPQDALSLGSNEILRDYLKIKIADVFDEIVQCKTEHQADLEKLADKVRRLQMMELFRSELDGLREEAQAELARKK